MPKIYYFILIILFYINNSWAAASAPIADRIVDISARFLGKPYIVNPLGEGPQGQFSQQPLYRFDGFDCMTYVETVLALAFADDNNQQQFEQQLTNIRYSNGKPDFFTRNHFTDADWIPHNIRKNYIKYSYLNNQKISIIINKKQWFAEKTHQINPNMPDKLKVTLPYMPARELPNVADQIPNGAIIMIIRPTFLLVSHMGFAVWENNGLYFREASSIYHKVVDVPLLPYIQQQAARHGVKGITVLVPQEQRQKSP